MSTSTGAFADLEDLRLAILCALPRRLGYVQLPKLNLMRGTYPAEGLFVRLPVIGFGFGTSDLELRIFCEKPLHLLGHSNCIGCVALIL